MHVCGFVGGAKGKHKLKSILVKNVLNFDLEFVFFFLFLTFFLSRLRHHRISCFIHSFLRAVKERFLGYFAIVFVDVVFPDDFKYDDLLLLLSNSFLTFFNPFPFAPPLLFLIPMNKGFS